MAELTPQERLQPSLLDRLSDDEPNKSQESRDTRVLSLRRLKQSVLRDLSWLLNTGQLQQTTDLDPYPEIRKSVLNYGTPDLSGSHLSAFDVQKTEIAVLEAIRQFEPRILPNTLKIRAKADENNWNRNAVQFEIEGMLWSQPLPQRLFLLTNIDLETGEVNTTETV